MSEEIKNCPYCGSEATCDTAYMDMPRSGHLVLCSNEGEREDDPCCYAARWPAGEGWATPELAIERWNTRAPDPTLRQVTELLNDGWSPETQEYDTQAVNQAHRVAAGGEAPRETKYSDSQALSEAVSVLENIRQYGSDTLSGRIDGPDDREWQRESVLVMRDRADSFLLSHPELRQKND